MKKLVLLLSLLLAPLLLFGQITLVNTASSLTAMTSATSVATVAFNATAGNLIACGVRQDTDSVLPTGVSDTAGNTWTNVNSAALSTLDLISLWYAQNIIGNAADVVTATWATNKTVRSIICHQYSGIAAVGALDAQATGTATTAATSVTSGAFSTVQASEVAVVFVGSNSTTAVYTAGTGYVLRVTGADSDEASEDQIFSATQTGVTASMSANIAVTWEMVVATFKASAAAPTCTNFIALLGAGCK